MSPEIPNKLYELARAARALENQLRRAQQAGRGISGLTPEFVVYCLRELESLARQAEALADLAQAVQGGTGSHDT